MLSRQRAAADVKTHYGELIPGPLQTVRYARALMTTALGDVSVEQIEAYAAERARRLERFVGDHGPRLWVVIGEAALHRRVGGLDAHREQLGHLLRVADLPRLTLQILPFNSGEHSALGMDFTILELADPSLTVVYVEGLTDSMYRDATEHTERHRMAFTKVQVAAANERESRRMIDARLRDLA